jgi:hypothetical protein
MPELLDVAGILLSSAGVSRSKLVSNITQILELDTINLTAIQDTRSFRTDGFYDFSIDKLLNPEPGIIRLRVSRLKMAVATSKARNVVGCQHSRHKLQWRVNRFSVQRLHRCRISFLGLRMLHCPFADRSLLRNLKSLVLRNGAAMDLHPMVGDAIWLL